MSRFEAVKTETVEWIGPEREIPGYGMARTGEKKTLPTEIANSFIRQGLAKRPSKRKSTTNIEVSSGDDQ